MTPEVFSLESASFGWRWILEYTLWEDRQKRIEAKARRNKEIERSKDLQRVFLYVLTFRRYFSSRAILSSCVLKDKNHNSFRAILS